MIEKVEPYLFSLFHNLGYIFNLGYQTLIIVLRFNKDSSWRIYSFDGKLLLFI